jgi:high-affinity nickel permease
MILVLRVLLFLLAFVFCFLLGSTSEGLLLEVVRRFVSVDPSNAVFFNAVLLAVSAAPVLLFGAIGSVSLSGEKIWNRRLWQTVAGLLGALISVRNINPLEV